MFTDRLYVVDRIEGRQAVLIDDRKAGVTVDRRRLPRAAKEGMVLRVPLDAAGHPLWQKAVVDEAETARRLAEAEQRLEQLKQRDPGGDITL